MLSYLRKTLLYKKLIDKVLMKNSQNSELIAIGAPLKKIGFLSRLM